jgi:aminoglycoside phosphotransferase (APT) family kinase protein
MTGQETGGADKEPRSGFGWPPHGFVDDDATRSLLRSAPDEQALSWASMQLGSRVISAQALQGGITSAVHILELERGASTNQVVMRTYVRSGLVAEEPDIAEREARVLEFLATSDIPAPRLLGLDATGAEAGVPAVLMTRLFGSVDWWTNDFDRFVGELADLAVAIHSVEPPEQGSLIAFEKYEQSAYVPPPWATKPRVWERAFEIFDGPAPAGRELFIQRDFHPGNVLFSDHVVTGVVDWQAACTGPASVDIGHCRTNLYRFSLDIADRFKTAWEHSSGQTFDPWGDIVSIVGALDLLSSGEPGPYRQAVEASLTHDVAELGV